VVNYSEYLALLSAYFYMVVVSGIAAAAAKDVCSRSTILALNLLSCIYIPFMFAI